MSYNRHKHGDFCIYYDQSQKRHYWVLGYFGGGAVNIVDVMTLAKDYAKTHDVPLGTVVVDEILKSRRYKGFKYIYSTTEQPAVHQDASPYFRDNVFAHLTD